MENNKTLAGIRSNLFYGLLDYTKSFPDFSMPQNFHLTSPKKEKELFDSIKGSLEADREIMLYFHLPFCFAQCVFCNAIPHKTNRELQGRYVASLLSEFDHFVEAGVIDGKKVKCVYLGGGTPTAFPDSDIRRIIERIKKHADLAESCNITCETHPDNVADPRRLEELMGMGINRISMGCQTFDPRVSGLCNRSNSESRTKKIVERAGDLGLPVNIDMMLGLPGQTVEGLKKDLEILDGIRPAAVEFMRHEIVNPLAIALYKKRPELIVDDDALFSMICLSQEWIEANGYEQNGHFTSDRFFPYRYHWLKETPFISFGSRSRSYTKEMCFDTHEVLPLYFQLTERGKSPIARAMTLSKMEQMYRSLFLNIQVRDGLDLGVFRERFGQNALEVFSGLLENLTGLGCVGADDGAIRLTRYGRYFVEDVCCYIIDDALKGEGPSPSKRLPHSLGAVASKLT